MVTRENYLYHRSERILFCVSMAGEYALIIFSTVNEILTSANSHGFELEFSFFPF